MKASAGFVMITVMLMLSVIIPLVITENTMIQLALRRQLAYKTWQAREIALEEAALTLASHLPKTQVLSAEKVSLSMAVLQRQLMDQGIDYATHYRYLVTELGDYNDIPAPYAGHHQLLTVMDKRMPKRVVQLRIAILMNRYSEDYSPWQVRILSWRSLTIVL